MEICFVAVSLLLDLTKTYVDCFKGVNSFCRNDKIRRTVSYRNNTDNKVIFPKVIMKVMLNMFEFVTSSSN